MKELQVRNRQRERRIKSGVLRRMVQALLEEELGLVDYQLAIHLVSAARMTELNEHFLEHAGSTDVITFDYRDGAYLDAAAEEVELAGEIYISVADAVRQAREFSTSWPEEVLRYAVHGVLHLRGYDDLAPGKRRIMKREENRLTRRLAKRFPPGKIRA
jgi:probable rRNA maturation factor